MATETVRKNADQEKRVKKNYHEGHRDRMRQRFRESGIDSFAAHEALELLLYYCIPRRDTNEIAHELLAHFDNSLSAVFDAPIDELMKVNYISFNAAVLIKMIPSLARLYVADRIAPGDYIRSSDDAKKYFRAKMFAREVETFMMAYLDNGNKVINCETIAEGSVNAARVDMNKIVTAAVSKRASACVAAHNHPRGSAFPSKEDVDSTRRIMNSLGEVNVNLLDHVIVGAEEEAVISMAESFQYGDMFKNDHDY